MTESKKEKAEGTYEKGVKRECNSPVKPFFLGLIEDHKSVGRLLGMQRRQALQCCQ